MSFQPRRTNYPDRSGQAYRTGTQLGYNLLDAATHMFPRNSGAFLAGLRKALLGSDYAEYEHEESGRQPNSRPPESLRSINLELKNQGQKEA